MGEGGRDDATGKGPTPICVRNYPQDEHLQHLSPDGSFQGGHATLGIGFQSTGCRRLGRLPMLTVASSNRVQAATSEG